MRGGEVEKRDPLRHLRAAEHLHGTVDLNGRFGPAAERFARFFGTVKYLAIQTIIVIIWITLNAVALFIGHWDPYPFILLNLIFSTQAAYAAPLILLAQNREAERDKVHAVAAAQHAEELSQFQLAEIRGNTEITEKIDKLTAEIHAHIMGAAVNEIASGRAEPPV